MLAHAACIAEIMAKDLPRLIAPAKTITIFSSAPKAGVTDLDRAASSIAALALALQHVGVRVPITIDIASASAEVPISCHVMVGPVLQNWLERASQKSGNGASPLFYAYEHPAGSMFGDIGTPPSPTIRVTIGALPEAKFWAVRNKVSAAARNLGLAVCPAIILVLKACRIPWYSPTSMEPEFWQMSSPASAIEALDAAANPSRGGNPGLKREARALHRFAIDASLPRLLKSVHLVWQDWRLVQRFGIKLGPNLIQLIC
jgi:hypothetical protein